MKASIILSVLVLGSVLVSCRAYVPIESVKPHNNETYRVEYLFEYDGCKVYRFRDDYGLVYFTNCNGSVTSIKNDSTAKRVTTITHSER